MMKAFLHQCLINSENILQNRNLEEALATLNDKWVIWGSFQSILGPYNHLFSPSLFTRLLTTY